MPSSKNKVDTATIEWDENGQPISKGYGDVYFSKASGLEETRYVFLEQNQLTDRIQQLKPNQHFTIAETGFGTGLNFLATWQLWNQIAPKGTHLHFISVEKHPLSVDDLRQSLDLWPELKTFADSLIAAYPPCHSGTYRLNLTDNVSLTLMIGEAENCFSSLAASVDAWFLDGFAPSKNPEMWTDVLFQALAVCSHNNTTFSTFTAAGIVKRGLQSVGFATEKVKGFGRKREMLRGAFQSETQPDTQLGKNSDTPVSVNTPGWFRLPHSTPPESVIIVGAGIAGCSTARALANKGIKVTLLDQHEEIANEASGNPQGVLYAKLPAQPTKSSRIHWAGLHHSLRLIKQLIPEWQPSGVLQLGTSDDEQAKQQKLAASGSYPEMEVQYLSAKQASEVSGIELGHSGLWFSNAGWINPKSWCQQLIDHPNISVISQCSVTDLQPQHHQGKSSWLLETSQGQMQSSAVIICCANQAKQFAQVNWLPTKAIRGQVSSVYTPTSIDLECVLCGKGYISPPLNNRWCFGATFNLNEESQDVRDSDHGENLAHIEEISPNIANNLASVDRTEWQGRVAFRCASPDYLPIVGPIPVIENFVEDYQALRNNAKAKISTPATYADGLYVNIAHGSKGLITAPLCAEFLANLICNEPLPLEKELIQALLPARFLVKNLVKKAI